MASNCMQEHAGAEATAGNDVLMEAAAADAVNVKKCRVAATTEVVKRP